MEKRELISHCSKIFRSSLHPDTEINEYCTIRRSATEGKVIIKERVSLKEVVVSADSLINAGTYIENAIIGSGVLIGPNCTIVGVTHNNNSKEGVSPINVFKKIIIEDNVFIGAGVTILPGVKIGSKTVIGAGSVVAESVYSHKVYTGTPQTFRSCSIKK